MPDIDDDHPAHHVRPDDFVQLAYYIDSGTGYAVHGMAHALVDHARSDHDAARVDQHDDGRTHYYGDGCPDDHGADHLVPRYGHYDWPLNDAAQFVNACHNIDVGGLPIDGRTAIDLADVEHLHAVTGRILDEHRRRHPGYTPGNGAG